MLSIAKEVVTRGRLLSLAKLYRSKFDGLDITKYQLAAWGAVERGYVKISKNGWVGDPRLSRDWMDEKRVAKRREAFYSHLR